MNSHTASDAVRELEFDVRDYECDLQGIVNHANYLHYLEHARHDWLKALGFDFARLTAEEIFLVAYRIEIDYKLPLRAGDRFVIRSGIGRVSRLRWVSPQDIFRLPDRAHVVSAKVFWTSMKPNGRPHMPRELEAAFEAHLPKD